VYPDPVQSWDALAGFRPGDRVHDARMAEDVKALATFDATPIHLKYLEHTYLEFEQWVKGEDMADELETQLEALGASAIFAPFGIANPDHVATHRASMIVRDRMLASGTSTKTPGTSTSPANSRGASPSCTRTGCGRRRRARA
jgi:LmbE family N-acetylglucosaminyl deacetylase